jgi:PIN domain nuclease of toxin-antitoxin system
MPRIPDAWMPGDRPGFAGPALIDTHIWLWYLDGAAERIHPEALDLLRRSVRGDGLLVSDISVWEVGMKAAKGHLQLSPTPAGWVAAAGRRRGFNFLPVDRGILLASSALPGEIHGDPADRILMATAALGGFPLVTADHRIVEYARREGGLSVCDARP